MPKILLVEDDEKMGASLKLALETHGFEVDWVRDGDDGYHWLSQNVYATAILDWGLPRMSGPEISRKYREGGGTINILMLTGKTEVDDIVEGLQSGADDYLRKPFEIRELIARVNSLCRRSSSVKSSVIQIGILSLDLTKRACIVAGTTIVLPRKEFAILELLMQNPGQVFDSERLVDRLWPTGSDTTGDTVRVHVTRLRQRLNTAHPDAGKYLVNVYGQGYKFEAPVTAG
jgi:DNA-binding response OmpR family regulator